MAHQRVFSINIWMNPALFNVRIIIVAGPYCATQNITAILIRNESDIIRNKLKFTKQITGLHWVPKYWLSYGSWQQGRPRWGSQIDSFSDSQSLGKQDVYAMKLSIKMKSTEPFGSSQTDNQEHEIQLPLRDLDTMIC